MPRSSLRSSSADQVLELAGANFRLKLKRWASRHKRPAKRFEEIVSILEIFARILVGFGENGRLYHCENDLAEIFAVAKAPFIEDGQSHRAILLESVGTNAFEQFLPSDVVDLLFAAAPKQFLGMIERLAHEKIGLAMISRIFLQYLFDRLFEICGLHYGFATAPACARAGGCACRQALTPQPTRSNKRTPQRTRCCCGVKLSIGPDVIQGLTCDYIDQLFGNDNDLFDGFAFD